MNPIIRFALRKLYNQFEIYQREKQEIIGQLYCGLFRGMCLTCYCPINSDFGPGQNVKIDFYNIKMCDIQAMERGRIKFFGDWYSLDDVFFNGEPQSKKDEIIARYIEEKKENLKMAQWAYENLRNSSRWR